MDVPQVIAGRFRIERELGTGGMGTVYLATHLGLERPVAVKIIRREFAGDADVAERFLREARTMAKLRHANAATIFDAGDLPDGRHFIVMEYVEPAHPRDHGEAWLVSNCSQRSPAFHLPGSEREGPAKTRIAQCRGKRTGVLDSECARRSSGAGQVEFTFVLLRTDKCAKLAPVSFPSP